MVMGDIAIELVQEMGGKVFFFWADVDNGELEIFHDADGKSLMDLAELCLHVMIMNYNMKIATRI